jgi:hypothetical protein
MIKKFGSHLFKLEVKTFDKVIFPINLRPITLSKTTCSIFLFMASQTPRPVGALEVDRKEITE